MLMTTLRLDDGRLVTVKHVWTEVHAGGTNIAVLAEERIYRRTDVTPEDAEVLRELLIAGGTFDERLNKLGADSAD